MMMSFVRVERARKVIGSGRAWREKRTNKWRGGGGGGRQHSMITAFRLESSSVKTANAHMQSIAGHAKGQNTDACLASYSG